ncbi:hypothetical protein GCM10010869_13110 [Mesorhizobium tianshanense]|nr:hypothetical protein GCM10010869_13110 [Mesorhizobium tianshanense]
MALPEGAQAHSSPSEEQRAIVDTTLAEGTATSLKFVPMNGQERDGLIGSGIPEGPELEGFTEVGSRMKRYFYKYTYDTRNWEWPPEMRS